MAQELTQTMSRIEYLKATIEHTISVIAMCRVSGQPQTEAAYEAHLASLNDELKRLTTDTEHLADITHQSILHKEYEGEGYHLQP